MTSFQSLDNMSTGESPEKEKMLIFPDGTKVDGAFLNSKDQNEDIKEQIFEFKFKDKDGRRHIVLDNKADRYLVVKEIIILKVPGQTNKIRIVLKMPQNVEVVNKEVIEPKFAEPKL